MDDERESQQLVVSETISLMAHLEQLCEQHGLQPPVGVEVTHANGTQWAFDYDPNFNEIRVPFIALEMPVTIRIEDRNGHIVQREFAAWFIPPEWVGSFVQQGSAPMTKIFISNFDSCTPLSKLVMLFEEHGPVTAVQIRQGERRMYAVVQMPNDSDAEEAIRALDGKSWDERRLDVKQSRW